MNMKLVIATCLLFLVADGATTKSEGCQKLTDFADKVFAMLEERLPPAVIQQHGSMFEGQLGFNPFNATLRGDFLCKIAAATNLRELHAVFPKGMMSDRYFGAFYKNLVDNLVAETGGYTNLGRVTQILADMKEWTNKMGSANYDLDIMTDFFSVMQVKYGSRWLSYSLQIKNQEFLIEDPKVFAKKFYESKTAEDVKTFTGLGTYEASELWEQMHGNSLPPQSKLEFMDVYNEGANIIGDLGLFNLE